MNEIKKNAPLTTALPLGVRAAVRLPLDDEIPVDTEYGDERRILICNVVIDNSISVQNAVKKIKQESDEDDVSPFKWVVDYLNKLASENETSVDVEYRVSLTIFDQDIRHVNDAPLPPEDVLALLTEDMLALNGRSTNITGLLVDLDQRFTRGGAICSNMHKGDYKSQTIILTDLVNNVSSGELSAARDRLLSNQLFVKGNETLVVYLGDEDHKHDAEVLCQRPENVIAFPGDVNINPVDLLIQSTIMFSGDTTHMKRDKDKDGVGNVIKNIQDRDNANKQDKIDDVSEAIIKAFGLQGGGGNA